MDVDVDVAIHPPKTCRRGTDQRVSQHLITPAQAMQLYIRAAHALKGEDLLLLRRQRQSVPVDARRLVVVKEQEVGNPQVVDAAALVAR